MAGYVLHLSEQENITLSAAVTRRLIDGGDGDAALLYLCLLKNRGSASPETLRACLLYTSSYWCRLYHKHLVHSSPYGTFSANSAKRQKNVCFLALLPNREQAAQQRKQAARLGHLLPYVQTGWA